jgi:hypothetical protein
MKIIPQCTPTHHNNKGKKRQLMKIMQYISETFNKTFTASTLQLSFSLLTLPPLFLVSIFLLALETLQALSIVPVKSAG